MLPSVVGLLLLVSGARADGCCTDCVSGTSGDCESDTHLCSTRGPDGTCGGGYPNDCCPQTPTPAPTPPLMFSCDLTTGTCAADPKGSQTEADCKAACKATPKPTPTPTPPPPTFACVSGKCQETAGGVSKAVCETLCQPQLMFRCDTSSENCVIDPQGTQSASDCEATCKAPTPVPTPPTSPPTPPPPPLTFSCDYASGECQIDPQGTQSAGDCETTCKAPPSGGLEIGFVNTYDPTYADTNCGAPPLSTWRANTHCPGGFKWQRVGDYAVHALDAPPQNTRHLVVRATAADTSALTRPLNMTLNWNNEVDRNTTHGDQDGGIYTPVCPAGYVALGAVGIYYPILESAPTPADFPDLYCVRAGYAIKLDASNLTNIWEDHGSDSKWSGSVWVQPALAHPTTDDFVNLPMWAGSNSSYDAPADAYTLRVDSPGVKFFGDVSTCDVPAPTPPPPTPPPAPGAPEQVHLALGSTPTTMGVQWSTLRDDTGIAGTFVQWAESAAAVASAPVVPGEKFNFTVDPQRTWYNHLANMTGLKPVTRYYYRVGDPAFGGWSKIFTFKSQVTAETLAANLPQHHIVIGDMGAGCAFSLCGACTCDLKCDATSCAGNDTLGLVGELDATTHILHVGDFAYNLADNKGTVGDQFFRNIEQLAAYVPYMVSIGNHEDGDDHLAHFTERFRLMPSNDPNYTTQTTKNGVAPNNWWYSWDDGLVHYVAISTEVYFGIGPDNGTQAQFKWLQADLEKANANRANVPWIAVHGHRSIYCSCDGDCDESSWVLRQGEWGLEELLFEQGVDLFLNGHEHNYERNWPTYRNASDQSNVEPKAPIYIVSGAAGCDELHEPFTRPQPPRSAFRSNNFGYSRMIIHNHTHLHWQQVITDPGDQEGNPFFTGVEPYGTVLDDTWIIQSNHGPFSKDEAPKEVGKPIGVSIDHWEPRLRADLPRNDTLQIVELIADFRKRYGQGQWLNAELKELDEFREKFGSAARWEDVSPDGSSDGRWDKEGAPL